VLQGKGQAVRGGTATEEHRIRKEATKEKKGASENPVLRGARGKEKSPTSPRTGSVKGKRGGIKVWGRFSEFDPESKCGTIPGEK